MTEKERAKIVDLTKCDFRKIHAWYASKSEERKARSKEEKNIEKEKNAALITEYGWCTIDGHKQKIGNFRAEPPSLFRGRGEHPKMGKLKKRLMPEEVIINCAKDSVIPVPPAGHKWKEVMQGHYFRLSSFASIIYFLSFKASYISITFFVLYKCNN